MVQRIVEDGLATKEGSSLEEGAEIRWVEREGLDAPQQRALLFLERWGRHATSFQILEPGYEYWFAPDHAGVVAYARKGRYWVVVGPPIASELAMGPVVRCFLQEVSRQKGKALFVSVEADWLALVREEVGGIWDQLPLGVQPEWSLSTLSTATPHHKTLRSQVRRALRKGVSIRQVHPGDDEGAGEMIAGVVAAWMSTRSLPPLGFMVAVAPYHLPSMRRYFVATVAGKPVAMLIAIPVLARNGWFVEDVLRTSDAPNGTIEALIDHAMHHLQTEGAEYLTLGLSPLAGIEPHEGNHSTLQTMQHWVYQRCHWMYQFAGLYAFKRRFVPDQWTTQYLVAWERRLGVRDMFVLVQVLLGAQWGRVITRTVQRGWSGLGVGLRRAIWIGTGIALPLVFWLLWWVVLG